jgi:adenylate cyclase
VRRIIPGLSIGVGAAATVMFLAWLGLIPFAEAKLHDALVARHANANPHINPDIVLVEINDASIRDLTPIAGGWPWPRLLHGKLIGFLKRGGARVIVYDILFSERSRGTFPFGEETITGEASDQALVDATREAGNVIFLADAVDPGLTEGEYVVKPAEWKRVGYRLGPAIEERPVIQPPFQALTDVAAGIAHDYQPIDPDGVVRRSLPFIRKGDRYLAFPGIAAALAAGGYRPDEVVLEPGAIRVRDRRIPLATERVAATTTAQAGFHDQLTMLVNFDAPVLVDGRRAFRSYEARTLLVSMGQLEAGEKPLVDPAVFKDKVVFVGLMASGLVDVFQTPLGSQLMPGIQLHATIADNLLSNRFLRPAPGTVGYASTIALALAVGVMATRLPLVAALGGAAAIGIGWTWLAYAMLGRGLWLDTANPLSGIVMALFLAMAYRSHVADQRARRLARAVAAR